MSVSKLSPKQQADVIIQAKSDEITALKAAVSKAQTAFENIKTTRFDFRETYRQSPLETPKAEGSVQIGTPNCFKGVVSVIASPNSSLGAKVAAYIVAFFTYIFGFGSSLVSEADRQIAEKRARAAVTEKNKQIQALSTEYTDLAAQVNEGVNQPEMFAFMDWQAGCVSQQQHEEQEAARRKQEEKAALLAQRQALEAQLAALSAQQ